MNVPAVTFFLSLFATITATGPFSRLDARPLISELCATDSLIKVSKADSLVKGTKAGSSTAKPLGVITSPNKNNALVRLEDDFIRQAFSPFSITTPQAIRLGVGVAITAGLFLSDKAIDTYFDEISTRNTWLTSPSNIATQFGSTYAYVSVAAFAGYSFISGDPKARETTLLLGEAVITSGVWATLIKAVTGRERPYAAHNNSNVWTGPNHIGRSQWSSFPSGHSTTAFAVAKVLADQYANYVVVPYIVYTLASTVVLTRIELRDHWGSDCVIGAVLGYLCAVDVMEHSPVHKEGAISFDESGQKKIVPHFYASMSNEVPTVGMNILF